MRCWHGYFSGARCKLFAYGPADATATQSSLLQKNPEWFLLTHVVGKNAVKRLGVVVVVAVVLLLLLLLFDGTLLEPLDIF